MKVEARGVLGASKSTLVADRPRLSTILGPWKLVADLAVSVVLPPEQDDGARHLDDETRLVFAVQEARFYMWQHYTVHPAVSNYVFRGGRKRWVKGTFTDF
jgi:hypothetical protein